MFSIRWRGLRLLSLGPLGLLPLVLLAGACASGGGPAATPDRGPVATSTPAPAEGGAGTPNAALAKFEVWPSAYKFRVSGDVVVLLAYPSQLFDFAGSVFIDHIPSTSSATLAFRAGDSGPQWRINGQASPDGRRALVAALGDQALTVRIAAWQAALEMAGYSTVEESERQAVLTVYAIPFGETDHAFDFFAEIIGGPDIDPELYCVGDQWDLGNIATVHSDTCGPLWVDPRITRLFRQSNSYPQPGNYEVTFRTGPLEGTVAVVVP